MKIIASDFDGTITHRGLTPELRAAIDEWRAAGNLFGIVTGRPRTNIHQTLVTSKFVADFEIADNGAVGVDRDGVCIFRKNMTAADVAAGINAVLDIPHNGFRISNVDGYCFEDCIHKASVLPGTEIVSLGSIYFDSPTGFFNRCLTPEYCESSKIAVAEATEGRVKGLSSSHITNDFVRSDAGKASGILAYVRAKGYEPEAIYTIGDAMNDLDMLLHPQLRGYAVENSLPEVKEKIGNIVASPLELIQQLM